MGLVTTAVLYALPYVLASVIGFAFAVTLGKRNATVENKSADGSTNSTMIGASTVERDLRLGQRRVEDRDVIYDTIDGEEEEGGFDLKVGDHIPFKMKYDFMEGEMIERSRQFYEEMNLRRSVRFYSSRPVPLKVIENIIRTAGK